jgi:hypothetical protein
MANNRGPESDDPVEQALLTFLRSANLGLVHVGDYRKFDQFTVTAYENGDKWEASRVKQRLDEYGLKEKVVVKVQLVDELVRRFEIGIEVLLIGA